MAELNYDLHIHSCLSPCGDSDMTPANIVGMALLKGLDVIAVTDHNSCKNCAVTIHHAEEQGLLVIPGMELTTSEEVHVVCLFNTLKAALEFDAYVYEHILPIINKPDLFGHQHIINEADEITGEVDKLLISATDINFIDVYELVTAYDGIMIPAHVDKNTTSLLSNLGFVPEESRFTCFECKSLTNLHSVRDSNPYLTGCSVITNSDAHYLWDINEAVNSLHVKEKSISGIFDMLRTGSVRS